MSLPLAPDMSEDDVLDVVDALRGAFSKTRRAGGHAVAAAD
jgi:hypothetical protein